MIIIAFCFIKENVNLEKAFLLTRPSNEATVFFSFEYAEAFIADHFRRRRKKKKNSPVSLLLSLRGEGGTNSPRKKKKQNRLIKEFFKNFPFIRTFNTIFFSSF